MVTIKTESGDASGAEDVNVLICAAGESPLPVVLRVGARVTIENILGKAFLVEDKKDRPEEEPDETIQVYVYDLWRIMKSPIYEVKLSDKVVMLKYQIFEREGIELRQQFLSVDGIDLNDLRTFADHNIRNDDAIKLYVNVFI